MFAQVLQYLSASSSGRPGAVAAQLRSRRSARAVALSLGLLASIGVASASASSKPVAITCRGSSSSCSAVINLAGGASNKKLRIALSDTDLKLVARVVKPSSVRGAYSLSHGSYSLGGSLYTVTLNAVQAIPRGATLTLKFAEPLQSGGGK